MFLEGTMDSIIIKLQTSFPKDGKQKWEELLDGIFMIIGYFMTSGDNL